MNLNNVITLFPTNLTGEVNIPPSKSLTHRALICASLAKGRSIITNVIFSDDILATLSSLQHIGAKFTIEDNTVIVQGVRKIKYDGTILNCNESGSTLRFLIPLLSLSNKEVIFSGKESLIKRPQSIYQKIFEENGHMFTQSKDRIVVKGSINAKDYILDGDISSQFFSGLLFALPLLKEDSKIIIKGNLESKSYIDLTIDILEQFGVKIEQIENGYFIRGNQQYIPTNYRVEGDFSQAAFFLVAGVVNGNIKINDLEHDSIQGDKEIIDIIKHMKGKVIYTENGFVTEKSNTAGTTIDISNCPDLGPIIAVLGALSKGSTTIINAHRLRLKESDRILSTVNTLSALGATIKNIDDKIVIYGKKELEGGVTVDSYNDHRIAMMTSIAVLRCKKEVTLTNSNAITKSYPHFYEDYKSVGGIIKEG